MADRSKDDLHSRAAVKVMTVKEVSDYLRIHPSTVYRLIKRRQIPAFRIGGDWRFNIEAIDDWRMRREVKSDPL